MKVKYFLFSLSVFCVLCFFSLFPNTAQAEWKFNPSVGHVSQPENWICGPSTIAMWAGFIRKQSLDPYAIADSCCGSDGTNIPEFLDGMFDSTPYGYVFSEWEYKDKEAAVKAIMWEIARFSQPVSIAGGNGTHYVLVRGGRADSNPYQSYSENNHIRGVWVNDSTEGSPYYAAPVSGMYKDKEYAPSTLMNYWKPIGAWYDKKYRSMERECYTCWYAQGATYENNDTFSAY